LRRGSIPRIPFPDRLATPCAADFPVASGWPSLLSRHQFSDEICPGG
jgi:hypothetical protein